MHIWGGGLEPEGLVTESYVCRVTGYQRLVVTSRVSYRGGEISHLGIITSIESLFQPHSHCEMHYLSLSLQTLTTYSQ